MKVECQSNLTATNANMKTAKQDVKATFKKREHGALSQPIRQSIEELLQRAYNMLRSAYDGGDFEGNHCRKFIRQANQVMDDIESLLLDVPRADRSCDDKEIRKCCRCYKRLFQCFDALIHHCHQPFSTLTESDMVDVRRLVDVLDRLWRRLFQTAPPKAHAWQHLVVDLERLRGLKHHSESKIEVSHQIRKKIDLLFRSVNDIEKKIECSQVHHHTQQDPAMKKIQQTVKDNRSRKRTAAALEDNLDVNNRQGQITLLLQLPEIDDEFPTLESLALDDRKREAAAENNNNNVNKVG